MWMNCIAARKKRVVIAVVSRGIAGLVGFVFAIFVGGCHPLPAGDVSAVARPAPASRLGRVYLIRGWRDLWSQGIDSLAEELREQGVDARVFRAAQWHEVAEAIDQANIPAGEPFVLIGFSYGADDAIEISRVLRRPVDLLIAIDPVTPPSVPGNVKLCYDFYETNGVWDVFPWLRGIPLKAEEPGELVNVDLRAERRDLVEEATSHSTIAADEKLHGEIVENVIRVCPVREHIGRETK
jgi:hypothetical protein